MSDTITFTVPFPAHPKQRPRLGREKVYNNGEYTRWKSAVRIFAIREATKAGWELSTHDPLIVNVEFLKDSFVVTLGKTDFKRHGRADLDNLLGGVLDALQPKRLRGKSVGFGMFSDDRQVVGLGGMFA